MKPKTETETLTLQDLISNKTEEVIENEGSDLVSLIAIAELTNLKKLKTITRLKPEQIPIMTKLYIYGERFGIPFMKSFADNIAELQVSYHGLGRKELVNVVNQAQPQDPIRKSLFASKEVFR